MLNTAMTGGPFSEGAVAVGDWGSVEGREQLIDRLLSAKV